MQRLSKVLIGASCIAGAGAAAFYLRPKAPPPAAPPAKSAEVAPARPNEIADPLSPERPMQRDLTPRTASSDWVHARPAFQYSRPAAERAGIEPCAIQRVDASGFEDWAGMSRGRFTSPRGLELDADGKFTLVIHLHGEDPVRRELVLSQQKFALYSITLPPNQGYAPLFTGTHLYEAIVAESERAISKRTGREAHVGHVALSAWSAGFVGIEAALAQPVAKDVDAVILIDGLHAPRGDDNAFKAQLAPFVGYAKRAAAGERFMFISHSSINPPTFASTTECAHYLVDQLGGHVTPVQRADAMGLELIETFTRGDLHVRGYAGNDKADHCAQLALLRDAYSALGRRWAHRGKSPAP